MRMVFYQLMFPYKQLSLIVLIINTSHLTPLKYNNENIRDDEIEPKKNFNAFFYS